MDDQNSAINDLFTDNEPIDKVSIVNVLKKFIRIKKESNEIFLTDIGNELNVVKRILVFGIGKKLLKMENYIETDSFSAKEVAEKLQLKKGTVDASFNTLRTKGYILGSGSEYIIPNYKISDILVLLEEKNERSDKR